MGSKNMANNIAFQSKADHPQMRGHFWSRDKDGGYTIQSATAENHMPHAKCTALCFIDPVLLPMEVLYYGNRDFGPLLLM